MVNLPEGNVPPATAAPRPRPIVTRYIYKGQFFDQKPTHLLQLEELADKLALDVDVTSPDVDAWQLAMNRARQLFNMEFKMFCAGCGKTHYQDEISAPER